jgi:phage shock protein C
MAARLPYRVHTTGKESDHIMNDIRGDFRRQGLVRPQEGRILAGVCAGLGRRFGMDAWAARLLFVLVLLVIPGSQILIYPILWILMPSETQPAGQPFTPAPVQAPGQKPASTL